MSKINIDINIVVNNKEANDAINETRKKEKELKEQIEKPSKIIIQTNESLKKINELEKVEKDLQQQIKKKKEYNIDTSDAENDLKQIQGALRRLGREEIKPKIEVSGIKKFGGVLKNEVNSGVQGLISSIPVLGTVINTSFAPILPIILAIAGGIALLKESFDALVDKENDIDRLSTALNTTKSQAELLRNELIKLASVLNVNVDDLTQSYILLANQGLKPTTEELKSIVALAKQSGKSVEDVADAVAGMKRGETDALQNIIGDFEIEGGLIRKEIEGVVIESDKALEFVNNVVKQKNIGKVLESTAENVGGKWNKVTSDISNAWNEFLTTPSMKIFVDESIDAVGKITVAFIKLTEGIFIAFDVTADAIIYTFKAIGDAFVATGDAIVYSYNAIVNSVNVLINIISDSVGDAVDFMIESFDSFILFITDSFPSIKPFFDDIGKWFNNISKSIDNFILKTKEAWNVLLEFIGISNTVQQLPPPPAPQKQKQKQKQDDESKIDSFAGEKGLEKEEEKKKEVKDKAAKADSDRRKSALTEAEKLIKKEVDTALFELERKVIEGKVFEEDAAAQKILIEEQANIKILELAKKLANEKSNLFKLEKDEVEKHTYNLLQIQRKYELELLKLSQKNLDLAINALNKQLDLKKSLIEKDTDEQIKTLEHQQEIRKINGTETKKTEQETSDSIFNLRREAVYKQIELEEEKVARLKVLGVDYVADYEEMYDKIRDINREQQKETEENTKKEKDKLFEFLAEVSGQFGEVGGHFAKIFKGIDDFLKADKMADKVAAIGEVAKATVAAFVDLVSQVNQMQIDKLDAEIEKRKENIDAIKEETEAILERDLTIAEIENKLAEQRIEELEALQEQLPEAQRERAEKDIETERSKIQNLDEIKNSSQKQEERRIKKEERAIEQAEKKKRQLQAETFEVQKQGAIITTLINTAVAIIQSYAQLPLPAAIAASIIITALGATQVALIASQENPYRLAGGTLDTNLLRHPSARQGEDSIPALLMPGEAVIPTDTNRKYHKSIEAIFNERIPSSVLNNFVLDYLNGGATGGSQLNVINNNINADGIIKAIRDKESVRLNIDEDGLSKYVIKTNLERKIMNKKLRKDV